MQITIDVPICIYIYQTGLTFSKVYVTQKKYVMKAVLFMNLHGMFFRDVNLLRSLGLKDVYGKIVTKSWGREEGGA